MCPIKNLNSIRKRCAERLLGLHWKAGSGHIGASLSCLEILVYLFSIKSEDDVIFLSKGHAATALYSVLCEFGFINESDLATFYQDGTFLAAHPGCSNKISGILFGTGSLGHGLSLATGTVFSQKFTKKSFQVYCILSDGDCNEGSTWEAALFAQHHRLSNLMVILDGNGLQGFGTTAEIMNLEPKIDKWRSFGFEVSYCCQGNNFTAIEKSINNRGDANRPFVVLADTIKGHGVSFMENKMEWHYLPMNEQQYRLALLETETKE